MLWLSDSERLIGSFFLNTASKLIVFAFLRGILFYPER
jgi:hypothetical protein